MTSRSRGLGTFLHCIVSTCKGHCLANAGRNSALFTGVLRQSEVFFFVHQIFEYNGAAIVAMAGKECIAIGSDLRFGVQFQTLATDYKKVYKIHDKLFIGLAGLGTDAQTM